ncbi:hypothetical protein OAM01_01125 [bacterium]|nr:hypothetical protein [bacterium]
MKNFDQKWKECIARAHKGSSDSVEMPFGFPNNVLKQLAQNETFDFYSEGIWLRFGLRTLAGVSLVLLILSVLHRSPNAGGQLLPPPIENSIVDYSGLL